MASQPDRLLLVEDDARDRKQLSERLARRGYHVDAADAQRAAEQIAQGEYDLVLLGHPGADSTTRDLLRLLRGVRSAHDMPVILLAKETGGTEVVEALRNGANDYLVKPVHMPLMAARIEEQLSRSKIGRHKRSSHAVRHAAHRTEGHWTWDVATNRFHLSTRARRMLAMGPEERCISGKAWMSLVHPVDARRSLREMREHLKGETEEFRMEHRVRNRLGRYEWLLVRGRVIRDQDGKPLRVCGTVAPLAKPDVDALTGMGTRVLILERLGASIAAQSAGTALTLLLLDLDGFSLINDSFGQETAIAS